MIETDVKQTYPKLPEEVVKFLRDDCTHVFIGPAQPDRSMIRVVTVDGEVLPGRLSPEQVSVRFTPKRGFEAQMEGIRKELQAAGISATKPFLTFMNEIKLGWLEANGITIDRSNDNNRHVHVTR